MDLNFRNYSYTGRVAARREYLRVPVFLLL